MRPWLIPLFNGLRYYDANSKIPDCGGYCSVSVKVTFFRLGSPMKSRISNLFRTAQVSSDGQQFQRPDVSFFA